MMTLFVCLSAVVLHWLVHCWKKWEVEKNVAKNGIREKNDKEPYKEAAQSREEWLKLYTYKLHVLFMFSLGRVSIG